MLFNELDKNKKRVFLVLLTFTVLAGAGFAVINFFRGQVVLAAVELLTALISAGLLLHVNRTESTVNFNRSALIYTTLFFSIMMYAISLQGVSITIFAWVLLIPLISYLVAPEKPNFTVLVLV